MQAQSYTSNVQAQSITASQSLATVQTMLKAGLGCITYLRDLLPVDNFNESYFTSSSDDALSRHPSHGDGSSVGHKLRRNVSAFKVMTVNRGFTEEGDKLLNCLEYGIFDALKNRYLRSFIFAIYLDNKDPNNIVEAYTFNFNYHTIPGTDTVIPVMNFDEHGAAATPKKRFDQNTLDPVAEAARKGLPPTLGEVKKSVKALLRRLINATTQMDSLPKRRYATFKLFYNDNTPADYEPPHFQPGDSVKDRWFLATHDVGEAPEKWSVGRVDTGYHSLNISIASVAAYLPSSTENNNAVFMGTTARPQSTQIPVATLTPAQEAAFRAQQVDIQMKDAEQRTIVWGVENDGAQSDIDAEGEDDDDYVKLSDGTYKRKVDIGDSGMDIYAPIGLRREDGTIGPLPLTTDIKRPKHGGKECIGVDPFAGETCFGGVSEEVPSRVGELTAKLSVDSPHLDQTQQISPTQELGLPTSASTISPCASSIAVMDAFANIKIDAGQTSRPLEPISAPISNCEVNIDTQMLKEMVEDGRESVTDVGDSEMLDLETQVTLPVATCDDPIESFGPNEIKEVDDIQTTPKANRIPNKAKGDVDNGLQCECEVSIEDECTFCEGGCGRWFHIWCMGYHSTSDRRIPPKFICFDCRVRADVNWDLIEVHLYQQMISKFKDLALFRRAIKVAEVYEPNTASDFSKLMGCENLVSRQLFKRLEAEGFIAIENQTTDDDGFFETRPRATKGKTKTKGKQANRRKNLQKMTYVFVKSSKRTLAYKDYFNPDHTVENRMLGLSDLKASFISSKRNTHPLVDPFSMQSQLATFPGETGSQTQEESQLSISLIPLSQGVCPNGTFKRKTTDQGRASKKIKISMGPAVDLGD